MNKPNAPMSSQNCRILKMMTESKDQRRQYCGAQHRYLAAGADEIFKADAAKHDLFG